MASVGTSDGKFALLLSEREFNELGFDPNREYEVVKAKAGLWVVVDKGPLAREDPEERALENKVRDLIAKKSLSERVEGKFEKYLNNKELAQFQKMLKEKKLVLFKLNESYKHGVYKLPEEVEVPKKAGAPAGAAGNPAAASAPAAKPTAMTQPGLEKKPEEYALDKDGFMVCKNHFEGLQAQQGLEARIKAGEVKGLKTFEGEVYFVRSDVLVRYRKKFLDYLSAKKMSSLDNAAKDLNMSKALIRVIAAFLDDQGELIEKRKGLFQIVKGYE